MAVVGSESLDDDTGDDRTVTTPRPETPAKPNFVLRRVGAGLMVVGVVAAFVAVATTRSSLQSIGAGRVDGTDFESTSSEPVEVEPTIVDVTTTPVATTAPVATAPIDLPDHHGFQDDTLYVAIYGTPGSDSLGVLGEQDVDAAVERAQEVSAAYDGLGETIVASFEIIASVASFDAGPDGDYSNESSIKRLTPWVEAADDHGLHVVLDLQAGRARFDLQVQEFEELLLEPHVGVALDPEWRVGPNEVPEGGQIGSVTATEVNATIDYLDAFVEENALPKKMLIVHQFTDAMISNKSAISGTDNVQVVIHMDGFGDLRLKRDTYQRVTSDLPDGVLPGWKNFYDEDRPTPTPVETMDNEPQPIFVSFQ